MRRGRRRDRGDTPHLDDGWSRVLHPGGIPHGPHPGTVEKSLDKKETKELAVMVDTFRPLYITKYGQEVMSNDYYKSWLE